MVSKSELHELVDSLPDEPSLEDLLYAIYVRRAIERGIADDEAGRLVSNEEAMKQIDEWLQSAGQ